MAARFERDNFWRFWRTPIYRRRRNRAKANTSKRKLAYSTATGATLPQEIQKAELDASTAKAGLDAQQKIFDSRKELFEQGALPRRDLDAAQVALAQARSQSEVANRQLADLKRIGEKDALKSATGQLEAAQGKFRGAAAQLSYSEIRSPIDGVVTDRPQFAGELATANQSLITVMDTTKLIAKSHIAQAQAAQLKVGNSAEIRVAGSEEPIASRVTLVSPALDPGSTTIEVWVEARKPNAALRPGMTVQLSIVSRSAKDALVVPTESLYKNDDGQDYVAVAGTNGRAQLKTVQCRHPYSGIDTNYFRCESRRPGHYLRRLRASGQSENKGSSGCGQEFE